MSVVEGSAGHAEDRLTVDQAQPRHSIWNTVSLSAVPRSRCRPRSLKQFLKPERIGLRHAGPVVLRAEWRDRGGLVEPDIGVELLRQGCIGVVAHQLCVRPIDDTDEALQLGLQKATTQRLITLHGGKDVFATSRPWKERA